MKNRCVIHGKIRQFENSVAFAINRMIWDSVNDVICKNTSVI